jgi:hypothetical protein
MSIPRLLARFLANGGTLRKWPGAGECGVGGHDYLLAFFARRATSARAATRSACSCTASGSRSKSLQPVPHRQYVFTLPRLLRPLFGRHRAWLSEICRITARLLLEA